MHNVNPNHAEKVKHHLGIMMAQERQSGDFLLASVVQDSLLYNLHQHADSQDLVPLAESVAQISIQSVREHMPVNEFSIRESMRGVMHAMVSLGGEPVAMSKAITLGAMSSIQSHARAASEDALEDYARAIVTGIGHAVEDMGIYPENVRRAALQVVMNTFQA